MRNLEHVRRAVLPGQPDLGRRFDIAGQKDPYAVPMQAQHERRIVYIRTEIAVRRVQRFGLHRAEDEFLAGAHAPNGYVFPVAGLDQFVFKRAIRRMGTQDQRAHVESFDEIQQPADVIAIRMRQDDAIETGGVIAP